MTKNEFETYLEHSENVTLYTSIPTVHTLECLAQNKSFMLLLCVGPDGRKLNVSNNSESFDSKAAVARSTKFAALPDIITSVEELTSRFDRSASPIDSSTSAVLGYIRVLCTTLINVQDAHLLNATLECISAMAISLKRDL
jgi:hypothetical protein